MNGVAQGIGSMTDLSSAVIIRIALYSRMINTSPSRYSSLSCGIIFLKCSVSRVKAASWIKEAEKDLQHHKPVVQVEGKKSLISSKSPGHVPRPHLLSASAFPVSFPRSLAVPTRQGEPWQEAYAALPLKDCRDHINHLTALSQTRDGNRSQSEITESWSH